MKKSILINGDEINHYIKDLRKIPVISHERQNEIFLELQRKDITKKEKETHGDRILNLILTTRTQNLVTHCLIN